MSASKGKSQRHQQPMRARIESNSGLQRGSFRHNIRLNLEGPCLPCPLIRSWTSAELGSHRLQPQQNPPAQSSTALRISSGRATAFPSRCTGLLSIRYKSRKVTELPLVQPAPEASAPSQHASSLSSGRGNALHRLTQRRPRPAHPRSRSRSVTKSGWWPRSAPGE